MTITRQQMRRQINKEAKSSKRFALFEHYVDLRLKVERLKDHPKIVCFCGSTRFIVEMAILMWEYEKAGNIVLGLHYMPPQYAKIKGYTEDYDHLAEMEGVKDKMDELHKRKIDICDEVFIVNITGYIGDSTRSEIEYAKAHGKPIVYLEEKKDVGTTSPM